MFLLLVSIALSIFLCIISLKENIMNKTLLSVSAFLLSASLCHGESLNAVKNIVDKETIKKVEYSEPKEVQYDFQKWIVKEKLIGKKWVEQINTHRGNEITTNMIIKSLPKTLENYQVRVIKDGTAVTMEYNPKRINITLDKISIIRKIYMG